MQIVPFSAELASWLEALFPGTCPPPMRLWALLDGTIQDLATVTAAYVIRECEARGYRAFWNAAQQNAASVALARRLGFQREQSMAVLAWSAAGLPAG